MMTVSLPLDKLSYNISLPLSAFSSSTMESVSALQTRVASSGILPRG